MKKLGIRLVVAILLLLSLLLCSCGSDVIRIAVPNDTTNEARALILLENLGLIGLREGAGISATVNDIVENPYNIVIEEVEAAQIPNILRDMDYAVINSNYAIAANMNPKRDSLGMEGAYSAYANILAVKEGNEKSAKTQALLAALQSRQVANYITETYTGSVVSVVNEPTDGYDPSVDYESLSGVTITVACSPSPHAEILAIAKSILAAKNIKLDIQEYTDYIIPNRIVEDGTVDANYFQHLPYLEDFNLENGTHIVSAGAIHVEPLCIYGGKQDSLDAVKGQ